MSGDVGTTQLEWARLLALSLPAIVNEATPYAALVAETAMLGHSAAQHHATATSRIAAFAAVTAIIAFATGLFNFLFSVVMARVGHALGQHRSAALAAEARFALVSALIVGGGCAGLLFALEVPLLDDLLRLGATVRAASVPLYRLRLCALPLFFVQRAATGVIAGLQHMHAATAVTLSGTGTELAVFYWALFGKGAVAGTDNESPSVMHRVGLAALAGSAAGAIVALSIAAYVIDGNSEGGLRRCCYRRDKSSHSDAFSVCEFLRDGAAMMGRSLLLQGSVFALSAVAARLPQQHGSVLAAHSITMQLWMLTSYIVDGFADVGTMLGSKLLGMLAQGSADQAELDDECDHNDHDGHGTGCGPIPARRMRRLVRRVLTLALGTGLAAAVALALAAAPVRAVFTGDSAVREHLQSVWPLLCVMQVPNAAVFGYDGFVVASREFAWARNVIFSGTVLLLTPLLAVTALQWHTLLGVWVAKAALNVWRLGNSVALVHWRLWRAWGGEPPVSFPCNVTTSGDGHKSPSPKSQLRHNLLADER